MVGTDRELDIALLKIEGNFNSVDLGDSDDTKIGEKVIAIGNPLGLEFTLTEGVISARDRIGSNGLPYYFQIDVPINPGNSGGPLINTEGEVIGINNFKVQGAEGLGFALEINEAKEAINSIAEQATNQTII
jgi:serine protease Do